MKQTAVNVNADSEELTKREMIDGKGLMRILSCGAKTAAEIGESANAKIRIGRRVFYNLKKNPSLFG